MMNNMECIPYNSDLSKKYIDENEIFSMSSMGEGGMYGRT